MGRHHDIIYQELKSKFWTELLCFVVLEGFSLYLSISNFIKYLSLDVYKDNKYFLPSVLILSITILHPIVIIFYGSVAGMRSLWVYLMLKFSLYVSIWVKLFKLALVVYLVQDSEFRRIMCISSNFCDKVVGDSQSMYKWQIYALLSASVISVIWWILRAKGKYELIKEYEEWSNTGKF